MVKEQKIAVNTFDDKRRFSDTYNSVLWSYNPSALKSKRAINLSKEELFPNHPKQLYHQQNHSLS